MDGQGRWLSFPDAATASGVSLRSVRRYVQEERYVTRWSAGVRELWLTADGQLQQNDQGRPSSDGQAPHVLAAEGAAVDALVDLLHEALDGKSAAEQAAAMWQERARNLEAENGRLQELLALPMHEEEQELRPRWWRFWQSR